MRRALALLVFLALALPAAAEISFLGIRNSLIDFALDQVSTPGEMEIAAESVEDSDDGATDLVGLTVADADGVWLRVDRLSLRWNAARILRGELDIERLAATGVSMLRAPNPASVAVEVKEGSELDRAPSRGLLDWPRSPITARVRSLELIRVVIAPGALAAPGIAFDATGALRDEGDEQSLRLNVTRRDSVPGRIEFDYLRTFDTDRLDLTLDAAEAAGGLVAALAGLPADSGARVRLEAAGPLTEWALTLDADVERVIAAAGSAEVDATGRLAAKADLTVTPGPALGDTFGEAVAAVLAPEARLRFDMAEDEAGLVTIREGSVRAAELDLDARGTFDRPTATADLDLRLEGRAGLSALAEGVDFTRFGFDGSAKGPLDDLTAAGRVTLDGLRTAAADVGYAALDATIRRQGERLSLDLSGGAEGLRLDRIGPDLLGRAELAVVGAYDGAEARLSRLRVAAAPLTLEAEGAADLTASTADLGYRLSTPDLAPLAAAYDADASGRLSAEGRLSGPLAAPRLAGSLAAEDLAFAGEPLGAVRLTHDATFGEAPSGTAALRADGSRFGPVTFDGGFRLAGQDLTLSDLVATGLGARIAGALAIDLETSLASGAVDLSAPDLSTLSAVTGQPASGAVAGKVALTAREGAQDAALTLSLSGVEVALEEGAIRAAAIDIDATLRDALGDPSATGRASAREVEALGYGLGRLAFEGTASRLRSDAPAIDADIRLGDLSTDESLGAASLAEARFVGRVENAVADPTVKGRLTASGLSGYGAVLASLDLSGEGAALLTAPVFDAAAKLGRIEAGGAAIAGADLTAKGSLEDLTAMLRAGRIEASGVAAASAALDLRAQALLSGDPALDAKLSLGAADLGAAGLASTRLTAKGRLSALDLVLSAAGEMEGGDPLSLDAAARADLAGAPAATVSRLSAKAGEAEIALRAPLRIRTEGGTTRFDGLDLALPGGGLTGAAALHPNGLSGALALDAPDLRPVAELAGAPLEAGALRADAKFDTRAGRAGADVTLSASGLRFSEAVADIGALGLDGALRWDGRTATLDAALSGPFGDPAKLVVSAPLRPSGGPLPTMPQTGALSGSVDWAGRVGDLWALVPAPGVVLDGDARVALRLSGTPAAPEFGGEIALNDGRLEHLDAGAILTPLTLRSRVEPGGAFVVDIEAEDGSGAPVTGRVSLDDGQLDAKIDAKAATLVRRDDATAVLSLDIAAKGPLAGPAISGTVGIDKAEIRLVQATPPGVADLGPVRIKGEPPAEPEAPFGEAIPLSIDVAGPQDIFVRGRGLDSEWAVDLQIRGTAAAPRITGKIEKRRGALDFLGRTFDLERGEVRFTGGAEIDPTLDIALLRDNDGVRGGIVVAGTAQAPDISFQSRPSLPEEEVLPRVLFGRSKQSLSAAEAVGLAAGLATLLDGTGGVVDSVRGAVGLDVLRIEGTTADDTTVTVGSNVASGVFVGAKQPVAGGSGSVVVEIEIFDELQLESEVGPDVGTNLGLKWKRDF